MEAVHQTMDEELVCFLLYLLAHTAVVIPQKQPVHILCIPHDQSQHFVPWCLRYVFSTIGQTLQESDTQGLLPCVCFSIQPFNQDDHHLLTHSNLQFMKFEIWLNVTYCHSKLFGIHFSHRPCSIVVLYFYIFQLLCNRISPNCTGSKCSKLSTQFVFWT